MRYLLCLLLLCSSVFTWPAHTQKAPVEKPDFSDLLNVDFKRAAELVKNHDLDNTMINTFDDPKDLFIIANLYYHGLGVSHSPETAQRVLHYSAKKKHDPNAWAMLGMIYEQQQNHLDAFKAYKKAAQMGHKAAGNHAHRVKQYIQDVLGTETPVKQADNHPQQADSVIPEEETEALKNSFYGLRVNEEHIIFVIDASGSMIESLPQVNKAVIECIEKLEKNQRFNVIYYQNNQFYELKDKEHKLHSGLKKASRENIANAKKRLLSDWIIPRGSGTPSKALMLAYRQGPDAIYLLTDNITGSGQFAMFKEDLILEVTALHEETPKTKIHGIQLFRQDVFNTLEELTKITNGQYTYVRFKAMNKE